MTQARDCDVIVVGSGIAAHCAALSALEQGASVMMLEAGPKLGGSSMLSTGIIMGAGTRFQTAEGISDDAEHLYDDYMMLNQWSVQPSIAWRLCQEAGPTIEWMADNGVEFTELLSSGMEKTKRGHATGGGDAIVHALAGRIAAFDGFESAVGTRVDRLLIEDGRTVGVAAGEAHVRAGAVVLALGGMGANPEMLSHWHPEALVAATGQLGYVGAEYARGDIVTLAMQSGAQIVRGRGIRNAVCVFLTGYWPRFAVVVNQLGRRFMDETAAYAIAELALPHQPGGVAYLLFDDAIKQSLNRNADIEKHLKFEMIGDQKELWRSDAIDDLVAAGSVVKAATIEDLAKRLGIPPANLRGTVDRYNAQVTTVGDSDFFKKGGEVPPLAVGPFYAAKITQPFYAFTGTGVRIDENGAVMHETNRPIDGLFAAGECVGNVLGSIYFGSGNSLANCSVYGRIAGRSAAERARASQLAGAD